ncbi:GMC family oxidoreductase [Nitratireductor indicus]|uniref:GMC family oxidoreductase n=1 Tax=Nitratireductor indicus TaxID=721133 RepID=UPI00287514A5|nr:GMC family oxidoreductase N-terminal domain-containing protein [Nitratireductor indicus]MDS1136153.1 GMC family oxidoreductase N-terminal domain-containing protein [Nitratireductor indicus]
MTSMTDRIQDFGQFDYIVNGGGSAGCVLANRLSANPRNRVLLLEGGGQDNWIWFHIPVGYLFAIGNPRADWMFRTQAEEGLNGRSLAYPRGKVLGGSSAINAMIYMRGQADDYNVWQQEGLPGWGWDDVLPYFLKHEDHIDGASAFHAAGGEWRVEHPRIRWKILDTIRDAAENAGIRKIDDFNRGDNEGSSYFQVNQRAGRRWSAARGFLKPAAHRPNLQIVSNATVKKVEFEGRRARAVIFEQQGIWRRAIANGEIILSTGAVASPVILEASGIGDGARLSSLGIETVQHAPGVGENLQDHLQIRPIFKVQGVPTLNSLYANLFRRAMMGLEYAFRRSGPLTMAPSQLGAFARSSDAFDRANLEFHFQPLSLDDWGKGLHPFDAFTASVCNLRPTSRGSIHMVRDDQGAALPEIRPRYLSSEQDRQVAVDSLKLVRRIVEQPALKPYGPVEFRPGPDIRSDTELLKAAGDLGTTIFHPVGTVKMGRIDDPMAVLDERLRVRGVDRLRVIDASIMPSITSGNTNSPTIMIAEKGAAMILEDAM